MANGFVEWEAPANESDEGRALLAEIRPDEMEGAEIWSAAYMMRPLLELDVLRLKRVLMWLKEERRERARKTTPGVCFQCGCKVAAGGSECRPCHENISPASYNRMVRRYHLSR